MSEKQSMHDTGEKYESQNPGPIESIVAGLFLHLTHSKKEIEEFDSGRDNVRKQRQEQAEKDFWGW